MLRRNKFRKQHLKNKDFKPPNHNLQTTGKDFKIDAKTIEVALESQ